MIESKYWKHDLLVYAKNFSPVKNPPRYSEKLHVNFEKDVLISFFMIRKLSECYKLSSRTLEKRYKIYASKCIGKVNNKNHFDIEKLYDIESESAQTKSVKFISNQLIHSQTLFAYRNEDRNWGGLYVCSDLERSKYLYRIPIETIIDILITAANDHPELIRLCFNQKTNEFDISTD